MKQRVEYWVVLIRKTSHAPWQIFQADERRKDCISTDILRYNYGPGNYKIIKQSVEV